MGGYGSGRHSRMASQMDEFHKIDLATFERKWFELRSSGRLTWSRAGQETGCIGYRLSGDQIELRYSVGGEPNAKAVRETIPFAFTEQPLGGCRRWLTCLSCRRRCRVLIGGTYFRCRQCYRATYPSQYEGFGVRGLAKAEKARERVGAEPGITNPFPRKPKGMHWRTYRRLEATNSEAVMAIGRVLRAHISVPA